MFERGKGRGTCVEQWRETETDRDNGEGMKEAGEAVEGHKQAVFH